jgi:cytoskeletal protein RodZ
VRPAIAGINPIEMSQSIGEKLRLAREARGIALREISEQTRISMRYLEAIEADDYKHLPGGIFNRSFIRAYAKFIGFDEHTALEDYARTLRERGETDDDGSKVHQPLVYTEDAASSSRSGVKTLVLAIIILAALSAAVWAGLHFYQKSQRARGASHQTYGRSVFTSSGGRLIPKSTGDNMSREGSHGFIA